MKRIFCALVAVAAVLIVALLGLRPKTDKDFMHNLSNGLEARWKLNDNEPANLSGEEYRKYSLKYINSELDAIGSLEQYTFENQLLEIYAEQYYNALLSQKESVQYYGIDNLKYLNLFTQGYINRATMLCEINKEYTIKVSDKYSNYLGSLLLDGEKIKFEDARLAALEELLSNRTATFDGNDYYFTIDNTTDYSFTDLRFEFKLYGESGEYVDTEISDLSELNAGSKGTVKLNDWNRDFKTVKMTATYYREYAGRNDYVTTNSHILDLKNDYTVDIKVINRLPENYSYYALSGRLYTSCTILDLKIGKPSFWYDGKTSIPLTFTGEKTYDVNGNTGTNYCMVKWKLYNENGIVVDSGSLISDKVRVGEMFTKEKTIFNLGKGKYTLELSDDRF